MPSSNQISGVEIAYDDNGIKIFWARSVGGESDEMLGYKRINAVQQWGLGTKWCTRIDYGDDEDDNMADEYLSDNDMFLIVVDGKKYAQGHIGNNDFEVRDVNDKLIDLKKHHNILEAVLGAVSNKVSNIDAIITICNSIELGRTQTLNAKVLEIATAKQLNSDIRDDRICDLVRYIEDTNHTIKYRDKFGYFDDIAYDKHDDFRWPEAEPLIAISPNAAMDYAEILAVHGIQRWPEGEKAIASESIPALKYAYCIVKGPWPEGERSIKESPYTAYIYAMLIKGPWPEAENTIAHEHRCAIGYAINVLRGRFPKFEEWYIRLTKSDSHDRQFADVGRQLYKELLGEIDELPEPTNKDLRAALRATTGGVKLGPGNYTHSAAQGFAFAGGKQSQHLVKIDDLYIYPPDIITASIVALLFKTELNIAHGS